MTEITAFPQEPQARLNFMYSILKDEGCFVFMPAKKLTIEELDLSGVDPKEQAFAKKALSLVVNYVNNPIIIDPFDNDAVGRELWKKKMEAHWGKLFKETYQKGRLRRGNLGIVLGAIDTLIDPEYSKLEGIVSKEEVEDLKWVIRANREEEIDSYSDLPLAGKMKLVDQVNQLAWRLIDYFSSKHT